MKALLLAALPVVTVSMALAAPVRIDLPEPQYRMKPGPGADTASICQACHSIDYVLTQPPHMGDKFWDGEVHKMIKSYGAPISEADAKIITAYLAANY